MIDLEVEIEAEGWSSVPAIDALVRRAADAAIAAAGETGEPLSATLLLAGDAEIRGLNRDFRGQDKPTNVLSFPASVRGRPGEPRLIGDVAIAFETVAREAAQEGKTVGDHTAHLVVHGILHLLGQDHGDDGEAEAMERTEILALSRLGIADPYRDLPA